MLETLFLNWIAMSMIISMCTTTVWIVDTASPCLEPEHRSVLARIAVLAPAWPLALLYYQIRYYKVVGRLVKLFWLDVFGKNND